MTWCPTSPGRTGRRRPATCCSVVCVREMASLSYVLAGVLLAHGSIGAGLLALSLGLLLDGYGKWPT